jgi:hypothetical protein
MGIIQHGAKKIIGGHTEAYQRKRQVHLVLRTLKIHPQVIHPYIKTDGRHENYGDGNRYPVHGILLKIKDTRKMLGYKE